MLPILLTFTILIMLYKPYSDNTGQNSALVKIQIICQIERNLDYYALG